MLLPLGTALFYISSGIRKKLLYGACLLAGCAGFIATLSRGAFVALLIAIGCSISMMYKSGLRIKHLAVSLVLLMMVLAIFSQQLSIFYDFFGDKLTVGDVARMELWKKAIQSFEQNPILGVGPGQFVNYTQESGADGSRLGAHSTYLQILAEGGVLGSIPIFALMIVLLRRAYFIAKTSLDPVQIAIWIGLLAAMIHNTIDSLFWTQHFQVLFWLLSAISFMRFVPSTGQAKVIWKYAPHVVSGGFGA
jgi:O-antigen ligase